MAEMRQIGFERLRDAQWEQGRQVRATFQAIMERDPDIAARYKRGKSKAIAHVAKGLLQKAREGDRTCSIFYLKTQAGWRETERHEHAGGLTINVIDRFDDDPA
jgi:hypothetical protein